MKKETQKTKRRFKLNRGSEILQVILIAGILLVLIITLFYPQMEELFTNIMNTISNWFSNTGSAVFRT
jgi:predicted PurR-regulated permease PerM